MKNLLVETGTALRAFGAASMTKAKPITDLYQLEEMLAWFAKTDASKPFPSNGIIDGADRPRNITQQNCHTKSSEVKRFRERKA